jgi:hypothetical protein
MMIKKLTFLMISCLLTGISAFSQVGIGTINPDPNSMLDVTSTNKGIIIPRVDFNNLPATPPAGFLVYVTANGPDGNDAFYYHTGAQWRKMIIGVTAVAPLSVTGGLTPQVSIPGASGSTSGFLSSSDYNALHLTTGSVPFYNGTGLTQNNAKLFWDNTNFTLGIGTNNPNASSILDLSSTTDGILIPRMTATQRTAISSPATGLLVYQTDSDAGFWFYDGATWRQMAFIGPNGGITRSYGHWSNYNLNGIATTNAWAKYVFSSTVGNSDMLASYDVSENTGNSRIIVSTTGIYQISITISLTNATGASNGQWAVYQGGVLQPETLMGINLGNGAASVITASIIATVSVTNTGAGGDNYFELWHNDALNGKTFDIKTITVNMIKLN